MHVSGHGTQDDIKEMLELTKPKYIVPGHAHIELKEGSVELAQKMGYKKGETLLLIPDQVITELKT